MGERMTDPTTTRCATCGHEKAQHNGDLSACRDCVVNEPDLYRVCQRFAPERTEALRAEVERLKAGDEQRVKDITRYVTQRDAAEERADAAEAENAKLREALEGK